MTASPSRGALGEHFDRVWYPHTFRGHFQQLSAEDRLIWSRFLDAEGSTYDGYMYDVPVGGVDCDPADVPEAMRKAWRYCTAKRIDVLARYGVELTIFECRYQAGVSAIGALLTYGFLFREAFPELDAPDLRLLSDHMSADTIRAAEHFGIAVTLYP